MTSPYYTPTGAPQTGAQGNSAPIRSEFDAIAAGFGVLPQTLTANKAVIINAGGTGMTVSPGSLALTGSLTVSQSVTLTGTGGSTVNFGAGGTIAYTASSVASIAGTANEITASASVGAVTLSLPTALTFTGKTVTGGTFASPTISGTVAGAHTYSGALTLSAALTYGGVTLSNAVTGTGNMVLATAPTLTNPVVGTQTALDNSTKAASTAYVNSATPNANKIINGDMRIDQRNAGGSLTPANTVYTLDRWQAAVNVASKMAFQQNAAHPDGNGFCLLVTSQSSYSVAAGDVIALRQHIEGLNILDLGWGTATAKAATLSFYVRSSLTGTFGGAIRNGAVDRSFPFTYTISAANTWELKTVSILADTTGTWLTTNGIGATVFFDLGVGTTFCGAAGAWASANYNSATGCVKLAGTNAAVLRLTNVKLEVGSVATPFVPDDYEVSLDKCRRYARSWVGNGTVQVMGFWGVAASSTVAVIRNSLSPPMRSNGSISISGTYGGYNGGAVAGASLVTNGDAAADVFALSLGVASGFTTGQAVSLYLDTGTKLILDAEL